MCTLIIARGLARGPELYVVSNRDEVIDRAAEEPTLHRRGSMAVLAPKDLRAGGTWIGLNQRGVFAGITNRFGSRSEDRRRSRGELVFRALETGTARRAVQVLARLSPKDYAGFHLVVADEVSGAVVWSDEKAMRTVELPPGYYVVTERSFGAASSQRLDRLSRRVRGLTDWSDAHRERFRRWMREHDHDRPLEGSCVHAEDRNYGTRSSTIVELGDRWRFAHAAGPPCSTPFRDHVAKLEGLGR